jgi:hypothetical protein
MTYKTFEGKLVSISEIDHQHLSNVFWYQKLVCEVDPSNFIIEEVIKRFDGKILPYKPHHNFYKEIQILDEKGHLEWSEDKNTANIIYLGSIVGKYVSKLIHRENIIDQIIN